MELNDYLVLAIALSGVLGIIGLLGHPSVKGESEAAIGIVCLFALISPLSAVIGSIGGLPELELPGESIPVGGYAEVSASAFCEGVASYISSRYSLDSECVSVEVCDFSFREMRAGFVSVRLVGSAIFADIPGIRSDVRENFLSDGGECKVVIDIGG